MHNLRSRAADRRSFFECQKLSSHL